MKYICLIVNCVVHDTPSTELEPAILATISFYYTCTCTSHGVIVIDNTCNSKGYIFQGTCNSNNLKIEITVIVIDSQVILLVIVISNLNVE